MSETWEQTDTHFRLLFVSPLMLTGVLWFVSTSVSLSFYHFLFLYCLNTIFIQPDAYSGCCCCNPFSFLLFISFQMLWSSQKFKNRKSIHKIIQHIDFYHENHIENEWNKRNAKTTKRKWYSFNLNPINDPCFSCILNFLKKIMFDADSEGDAVVTIQISYDFVIFICIQWTKRLEK